LFLWVGIEVFARKLARAGVVPTGNNILSRDAYVEAIKQAEQRDVVKVGTFESAEELDEMLGI
jgi:antitoxin component of RelBE/YafQ-DinJ toxin-antitoxin module